MKTLSTTRDAKWLLTADFEENCVVIVWDTEKRQILFGRSRRLSAKIIQSIVVLNI